MISQVIAIAHDTLWESSAPKEKSILSTIPLVPQHVMTEASKKGRGFQSTRQLTKVHDRSMHVLLAESQYTRGEVGDAIPFVTLCRLDPTEYPTNIENATKPYLLVYNESVRPGWTALESEREPYSPSWLNGHARAWRIEQLGSYDVSLSLTPNEYSTWGPIVLRQACCSARSIWQCYALYGQSGRERMLDPNHELY